MSLPMEQARALARARQFLLDLCVPGKIKRIPREVRLTARAIVKHYPCSWDLDSVISDDTAMDHMQSLEHDYRREFWKECGLDERER
jgi:hypothetical protein